MFLTGLGALTVPSRGVVGNPSKNFVEQGYAAKLEAVQEAARLFRLAAADQGDAAGQANLGVLYALGRGLTQDYREGAPASLVSQPTKVTLWARPAWAFSTREAEAGSHRMTDEAARLFRLAAGQGNALGQANLGFFYAQGQGGLTQDDREAARLYRLAADQGNALGQANLGFFYDQGRGGLTQDDREAARLYRLAADQGNATAQANLGFLYDQGRGGLTQDDREATRLYRLAADQGDATAGSTLGTSYRDGQGGLTG